MRIPSDRTEKTSRAARDNGDVDNEPAEQALPQREPGGSEATAAQADTAAADPDMLRKIIERLNRLLGVMSRER